MVMRINIELRKTPRSEDMRAVVEAELAARLGLTKVQFTVTMNELQESFLRLSESMRQTSRQFQRLHLNSEGH